MLSMLTYSSRALGTLAGRCDFDFRSQTTLPAGCGVRTLSHKAATAPFSADPPRSSSGCQPGAWNVLRTPRSDRCGQTVVNTIVGPIRSTFRTVPRVRTGSGPCAPGRHDRSRRDTTTPRTAHGATRAVETSSRKRARSSPTCVSTSTTSSPRTTWSPCFDVPASGRPGPLRGDGALQGRRRGHPRDMGELAHPRHPPADRTVAISSVDRPRSATRAGCATRGRRARTTTPRRPPPGRRGSHQPGALQRRQPVGDRDQSSRSASSEPRPTSSQRPRSSGSTCSTSRPNHALGVRDLPMHHRDPFDRLLVSQAMVERATLVTSDRRLDAYDIATWQA